jgi:hypothetical protein
VNFLLQIAYRQRLILLGLLLLATFFSTPLLADAPALRQGYAAQREQMEHSTFGAPINLLSRVTDDFAQGEVYAVLTAPFDTVRAALGDANEWCGMIILHVNVKACTYDAAPMQMRFYVGHKEYETPDQAYALQYRFSVTKSTLEELTVTLSAPEGPLGTRNYRMELEAIPLDAGHSFLHFSYAYNYNWLSRAALDAYLATLGRNKVGFTVTGRDDKQQPIYIKGIQGIVERNSMRYFLAIQAALETANTTQEKMDLHFTKWYSLIQRYPRQLVEFTREEYLEQKRLEYQNQMQLQKEISSSVYSAP